MKFSQYGHGDINDFHFRIFQSNELYDQPTDKPFYIGFTKFGNKQKAEITSILNVSHRFATRPEAEAFCEEIAAGKWDPKDLANEEQKRFERLMVSRNQAAKQEAFQFLSFAQSKGVSPDGLADVLTYFQSLGDKAKLFLCNKDECSRLAQALPENRNKPAENKLTLGAYLDLYQKDMDICIVDTDTGEHYMPALCYLENAGMPGELDYSEEEKWMLTLPLERIVDRQGCPMAVLNSGFSMDQTLFLLDFRGYESTQWFRMSERATYAGAGFSDRLAFLRDGKPFETPFNATCMDAADPKERQQLCEMLQDHNHIFITTFPGDENAYYVYTLDFREDGSFVYGDEEISISLTESGKGLASNVDGKIAWAQHQANKAKQTVLAPEKGSLNVAEPKKEETR